MNPLEHDVITLEDVTRTYPPKPLLNWAEPQFDGPVLAIGKAVYESCPQEGCDSRERFITSLVRDFPPGNLWLLPSYERLTYPQSVYWPLACAFRTEKEQGGRFDWFLWMDDDVLFDKSDVLALIDASKKHDLPFVAACPYDRMPPFSPSVVEHVDGQPYKWIKAPDSGSYPVVMVGFNLCLFRRDVFDVVPEPWFGIAGPSKGFSGVAPDWWWCRQMQKAGLAPWVCCDTNVIHLGHKEKVGRDFSRAYMEMVDPASHAFVLDKTHYTSPNTGAIGTKPPVYPDGRTDA